MGTGYSFTDGGFAENEAAVGSDLYEALVQFFQMFPDLRKNDFYVAGESYGGKFVPAVAYAIYKNNPSAEVEINLRGLAVGNGLSDREHQMESADYLYQIGLVDSKTKQLIQNVTEQAVKYIQDKQWTKAYKVFTNLLTGEENDGNSVMKNVTGFTTYMNYLIANDTRLAFDNLVNYIQREDARAAIYNGNTTYHGNENPEVKEHLIEDVMQSVAPWISDLLSKYRVLVYNGQLDITISYPATVNYLQNLDFDAADEYEKADRHQWWVGDDVVGYVKQAGNLTEVLVKNAGHMVPNDQPGWAFDLITRFTYRKPFF